VYAYPYYWYSSRLTTTFAVTFCTLVTSVILYQGLKASAIQIVTISLAFVIICTGIFILQMSRVDPRRLRGIDRRTSILLQVAHEDVMPLRPEHRGLADPEKGMIEERDLALTASEDPGIDALRGTAGALGTLIRARRRTTMRRSSRADSATTVNGQTVADIRVELQAAGVANGRAPSVFSSSASSLRPRPSDHDHGESEEPTMSRLLSAEGNEIYGTVSSSPPSSPIRPRTTSIRFASPESISPDLHPYHGGRHAQIHPYEPTHDSRISELTEPSSATDSPPRGGSEPPVSEPAGNGDSALEPTAAPRSGTNPAAS